MRPIPVEPGGLRRFVAREATRLMDVVASLPVNQPRPTAETVTERLLVLDAAAEVCLTIMVHGCAWSLPEQELVWVELLDRLLTDPAGPMHARLFSRLPGLEHHSTPASEYLFWRLQEPLARYCSDERRYRRTFDRFEYLSALIQADRQGGRCYLGRLRRQPDRARRAVTVGIEIAQAGTGWPLLVGGGLVATWLGWWRSSGRSTGSSCNEASVDERSSRPEGDGYRPGGVSAGRGGGVGAHGRAAGARGIRGDGGHVTLRIDNWAGLALQVDVDDAAGARQGLGPAASAVTTVQVADVGPTWSFVASYGGQALFRQTLSTAELERRDWTIQIPQEATAALERAGYR
jgi:catechol 2,3-dioxygenase-like lactoylglutathione lyase family enzyme